MRDDHCNLIAVWGSPNSGKTTFATKLALSIYDSYQATVVVLYPDLEAPVLPVLFPNEKTEELGSIGVPMSKTEIDTEDIVRNAITLKKRGNLVFLGYRTGDNRFTYPRYGRAKAEDFQVYYLDDKGNLTAHETKYENGCLVFSTTHFSDYVIVNTAAEVKAPDTGANENVAIYAVAVVFAMTAMVSLVLGKKKTSF